jgi:hypothetical protein
MLNGVNKEVISFLFKGDLPQQQAQPIQEAREIPRPKENYKTSKDELPNSDQAAAEAREVGQTQQRQVTETIVREMPKINRNDNVTIKHIMSGKTESMKYKKAESDLEFGRMGDRKRINPSLKLNPHCESSWGFFIFGQQSHPHENTIFLCLFLLSLSCFSQNTALKTGNRCDLQCQLHHGF